MFRGSYLTLAGCGGALAVILALEAGAALPLLDAPARSRKPGSSEATNQTVVAPKPVDVAGILARPLFNWNRRPAPFATTGNTTDDVPRLSGIMISASGRYAIFAGQGTRPLVVQEGGVIGQFTIDKIMPDHVEISGRSGPRRLQTRFGQAALPAELIQGPRTGSNQ